MRSEIGLLRSMSIEKPIIMPASCHIHHTNQYYCE